MNNVFILNASPIILLGKADLLQTVGPLAELWLLPEGVVTEVESKRQIVPYIAELEYNSKVSREPVQVIHTLVASWDLGKGESEVLTLAMKRRTNSRAVLDDLQARKCAKLLNLGLIGSVGLLVMAKRFGLIKTVKPEINKLIEIGLHIDTNLLAKVYQKIGEQE